MGDIIIYSIIFNRPSIDEDYSLLHSIGRIKIEVTTNQLWHKSFVDPTNRLMFPKPCNYSKLNSKGFIDKDEYVDGNDIQLENSSN